MELLIGNTQKRNMMDTSKIYADVIINEEVIVINKEGVIINEGIISKIKKCDSAGFSRNSIIVTVNGKEHYFNSSFYHSEYFFNKDKYNLSLHQSIISEMSDVVDKYVSYATTELTHSQCDLALKKIKELEAIIKPIAHSRQSSGCSVESFQKVWGNTHLTIQDITSEFKRKATWSVNSYDKVAKALKARSNPNNVISIKSAETKGKPKEDVAN